MKEFFNLEDSRWKPSHLVLAIFLSFLFSISLRYIWVEQFQNVESFKWLGQLMINTNDGYYFAEGARDIISGTHQKLDSSPIHQPLSQLTAILAQLLPFSFETIILWLPAVMGSLLVVPLILIGQTLRQPLMGLIGAILGSITWSYYNRTMVGYYDTDMLTVVLPTFTLWGILLNIREKENRFLLLPPIFLSLNLFWYPQSLSLNLALTGVTFLYTLIWERKEIFNYKLLTFLFLASMPIEIYWKFLIFALLFGVIFYYENRKHYQEEKPEDDGDEVVILKKSKKEVDIHLDKFVLVLFAISGIALIASGAFNDIIQKLQSYVFRTDSYTVKDEIELHFYNVVKTVREASAIPFETFANRISGHIVTFWISTLGVILMVIRWKELLIALPMVGLGYLAYHSGLRFTVYAVPIYALGLGYLIVVVIKDFKSPIFRYAFAVILTTLAIYPNYKHIENYRVPVVFNKNEVAVLDELKYIAKREDYVLAWWDYGYPIRFYSDVKTLVDGGQHSGSINFPVSWSLMRPPLASAYMARLAVEYREMERFQIAEMMKDRNITEPDEFLEKVSKGEIELPKKTREVYYYLPLRMLNILPTVGLFSQIDLKTGNQVIKPFFYQTNSFKDNGRYIDMGNGIVFDKVKATIRIGKIERPIESFYITKYDRDGKFRVVRLQSRAGANLSIIFMQSYGKMLLVDNYLLNSTYFRLFILETAPKDLFEPVIMTPIAKVYRLKI